MKDVLRSWFTFHLPTKLISNPITNGVMSRLTPVMGMVLKIRSGKTPEITIPATIPVTSKMTTTKQPIEVESAVSVAELKASEVASIASPVFSKIVENTGSP